MSDAFVQYTKKEENTTLGMPELTPVAPIKDEPPKEEKVEFLDKDVYAFIMAAPVASFGFLFSAYIIFTKYLVYCILMTDIKNINDEERLSQQPWRLITVKIALVPVAISMQEDLIHVFATAANIKYDKDRATIISKDATKSKMVLSMMLRLIDGCMSLTVNYSVMLASPDILGVFLNFAALHFLQSIDDVFFTLIQDGFFGDSMEHMSMVCTQISFQRRTSDHSLIKFSDTILWLMTLFSCYVAFFLFATDTLMLPTKK
mmetsp:Transcript_27773/g.59381  ORF Transcript_27773/g.59381 Transcript_27773/m.59381 type:complete len:260 (+) Transcript_27773:187-966(+)